MSLDGIVIRAITNELEEKILNGRIDKIYQPEKDELLINIRNNSTNYKLILSASSNNPRIYLTTLSKGNPAEPPMFCMLLRKHLQGGRISYITQIDLERVIKIGIEGMDELGRPTIKELIIEIMGRHSNIILIDRPSNLILDSVKRISHEISSIRLVLPGISYTLPPSQEKSNPLKIKESDFYALMSSANGGIHTYKFLYTSFMGLSPLVGREVCSRCNINTSTPIDALTENDKQSLYSELNKILSKIRDKEFYPNMIEEKHNHKLIGFSVINITQYKNVIKKNYISVSRLLEDFYYARDKFDRINQKSASFKKLISTKLDRSLNKLSKQKDELLNAKNREKYKHFGDLVTANLYKIEKGQESVELQNFYSEDMEIITVNLNPRLTPSQNAQKYYKRYNKLKSAYRFVSKQILKTQEEIDYLENVLVNIEKSTNLDDIDEIREELILEGIIRSRNKKNKQKRVFPSKPRHYLSSDGFHIYIGRNNRQNDYLTLKIARKNDIWLHTKKIPGSHVIIEALDNQVSDIAIEEAALLAAYYSKGSMSSNVPVDYTERRYVRKPKGAKPGMVIYDNNQTIYVTPDTEKISTIKQVDA